MTAGSLGTMRARMKTIAVSTARTSTEVMSRRATKRNMVLLFLIGVAGWAGRARARALLVQPGPLPASYRLGGAFDGGEEGRERVIFVVGGNFQPVRND